MVATTASQVVRSPPEAPLAHSPPLLSASTTASIGATFGTPSSSRCLKALSTCTRYRPLHASARGGRPDNSFQIAGKQPLRPRRQPKLLRHLLQLRGRQSRRLDRAQPALDARDGRPQAHGQDPAREEGVPPLPDPALELRRRLRRRGLLRNVQQLQPPHPARRDRKSVV